jgi:hypothetical protein
MKRQLLCLGLVSWLLVGCSTTVTNLTPSQMPRNATGLYPFEASWDNTRQSIRNESIKAYVLIGTESFPMQRTPLLTNRWETVVPIPAEKEYINYQYKFDYTYRCFSPQARSNSKLSTPYQLHLLNK